jgi:chaperonin cofactor prefoldin
VSDRLDNELHELDRKIEALRRRIWMVQHGLVKVEDVETELNRLDEEYRAMGDRFVEIYREWSRQSDA